MKIFIAAVAVLASGPFACAGLTAKSPMPTTPFDPVYKLACYPVANSGDAWSEWKIDYCDNQLNADNCLRFCRCDSQTITCDASDMSGCSNKKMAEGCSEAYYKGITNNHWYCECNIH